MKTSATVTVSRARTQLPKLLKKDSFAILQQGEVVGVYLSRDRMEALIETMELMADARFMKALRLHESGKGRFYDADELDAEMKA